SDPLVRLFGALSLELAATALDDAWLAAVPPDQLAAFAEVLARIDPPTLPTLAPAAACAGVVLHLAGSGDVDPNMLGMHSPLAAWRNGFSLRRAGMDRALEVAATVQQFDEATPVDEPWPERRLRLAALIAREAAAGGYAYMSWFAGLDEHEAAARRGVANLRLLRVAVAARLGQPLPVVADPLGRGPVRLESVDGVDFAVCGDDPAVRRRVRR
ncbi:MAG: hypothetical protein JNK15_18325, partial [Planctomycetes bacterium]|nr:hypothetical protein [Planctomycetota bacterium]